MKMNGNCFVLNFVLKVMGGWLFSNTVVLFALASFIACLNGYPVVAAENEGTSDKREVVLQLAWVHQFQFAGYYAAVEKGFYDDVGLDVKIRQRSKDHKDPVNEVIKGTATFGTSRADILLERLHGSPVVVLASIFQHSPLVFISLKESGINSPQDMIGKKTMLVSNDIQSAEYIAMLRKEGIGLDQINRIPSSYNVNDLITGKTDVFNGYTTSEPFALDKQDIAYSIIRPITYGVDFYGDNLFTSEREIEDHPDDVKLFREASLRGWQYAMENIEEIVELIIAKYEVKKSKQHLFFEAEAIRKLMLPRFIEIGLMNPGRWQHMADTYVELEMAEAGYSLADFIYDPDPAPNYDLIKYALMVLAVILVLVGFISVLLLIFNRRLNRLVQERTEVLAESEDRFKDMASNVPGILYQFRIDAKGEHSFPYISTAVTDILGLEAADIIADTNVFFSKVLPADKSALQDSIETALSLQENWSWEGRAYRSSGAVCWLEGASTFRKLEDGTVIWNGILLDTTNRRNLEEQLRQSQKLEAVGQLTGGIAHDFNNILSIVIGNLEILRQIIPDNSEATNRIKKAMKGALRGANIARKLLGFSRKDVSEVSVVAINSFIKNIEDLLAKSLTASINVETHFDDNLWHVAIDPGDLEDVILNLSLNARDAMPDGGSLYIETKNKVLDEEYGRRNQDGRSGEFVMISVSDTGAGISEEDRDKVLEPFFTTKEQGKGTGLGLSMVYGFTQRSGGHMRIYSEVGKGTTVRLYLPRVKTNSPATEAHEKEILAVPEGTEKILIVDDEEELRDIAVSFMQGLGYDTVTAENSDQALEILNGDHAIDLVFSDIVMPGKIDGYQLALKVHDVLPHVKILLTSGFTKKRSKIEENKNEFLAKLNKRLLSKPYSLAELAISLRQCLDEKN